MVIIRADGGNFITMKYKCARCGAVSSNLQISTALPGAAIQIRINEWLKSIGEVSV